MISRASACLLLLVILGNGPGQAQEYGARLGTVRRAGKVSYEPTGPRFLFDALDPTDDSEDPGGDDYVIGPGETVPEGCSCDTTPQPVQSLGLLLLLLVGLSIRGRRD